MKKEDIKEGMLVKLGTYKGIVQEVNADNVVVQFKTWSTINPWTGELPRISFTHYELLDASGEDE